MTGTRNLHIESEVSDTIHHNTLSILKHLCIIACRMNRRDFRFAFAFIYAEIRNKNTNLNLVFFVEREEMNEHSWQNLSVFSTLNHIVYLHFFYISFYIIDIRCYQQQISWHFKKVLIF